MPSTKLHIPRILLPLLYLWQLPQNLLGLGLIALCKVRHIDIQKNNGIYVLDKFWAGGVSLGSYIFLHKCENNERSIQHERGHQKQSLMLGPLYLIIVGIPSAILCTLAKYSPKISHEYFDHFPEKWADKLGGVQRLPK
ncbi:MAG: hypothetical protein IJ268_04710 [Proteobacteria bacterium]|nr:hypothetical protein [Pseudomonadota bacterium]